MADDASRAGERKGRYRELCEVPGHLVAELVGGELVATPRPAARHAVAASALGADLFGPFHRGASGGPGGWWILDEPELHLGDDVLVPDLAGWRRERMPTIPDVAFFELAPDWVCEILSPRTAALDRVRKSNSYASAGVAFLWLVDPISRTLESFRLERGNWVRLAAHEGSSRVQVAPFDAVALDMGGWWIDPEPPPTTP